MSRMRVEIRNRTGLTVVTSATATSRSVAIGDLPIEMDADAWAHTLACSPSLGRLVGEGPGMIEVRQVGASPQPGGERTLRASTLPVTSVVLEASGDPVVFGEAVKRELDSIVEAMGGTDPSPPAPIVGRPSERGDKIEDANVESAPVTTQPRQQGGGKRRR